MLELPVHSINRDNEFRQFANKGVEIVELDYTKPETITNAVKGVNKLFLQTLPIPQVTDICFNIVKEAKKNDVNYIVKLSAMGAESASETTLLRLHGEEEKIIKESGIPYTFLRPSAFMQNFVTQFGYTIKTQNAFYIPAGDAKMSFVDARDIGAVVAIMLLNENNKGANKQYINEGYDITGPEALTYSQIAETFSNEFGKKISFVDITEDAARTGMKQIGMNDWDINLMIGLFRIIRTGYGSKTTPAMEQVTGRKPISFKQFAKDYAEVFR